MNRLPRLVIALAVLLSGLALVPYVGLPAAAFNWQRYAGAYLTHFVHLPIVFR
jgi:hypothetical protein